METKSTKVAGKADNEVYIDLYGDFMPRGEYANLKAITAALTHAQYKRLKALSARTRVPMQQYLREGVDLVLSKHDKNGRAR